ncbi:MAG: hypothetical protein ACYDB0_00595 [Acidithiobacillus sp.]
MMNQRKKDVTPFVATFTMGSPVVLPKFGLPRLESLLRHRQVVTGGGMEDVLPVVMHHCGVPAAGGLFAASGATAYGAQSVTKGESIFQFLVNTGVPAREAERMVAQGHLRMKSNNNVVSVLQNWTILPAHTLSARGVGDPRAVLDILEYDPFIGVGTNLGYGEVLRFQVEEADWDSEHGDDPLESPWVFLDDRKRLTTPLPDTDACADIAHAAKGMIAHGTAAFQYPFRVGTPQAAFLPVNG